MQLVPSKFSLNQEALLIVPGVCHVVRIVRVVRNVNTAGVVDDRYEVIGDDGVAREATDECLLPNPPTRDAAITELRAAHETLGIADARWRQIEDVVGMSDPVGAVRALGVANDELTARVQELEETIEIERRARLQTSATLETTRETLDKVTTELGEVRAERRNFEQSLRTRLVDAKVGTSGSLVLDFERPSIPRSASRTLATIVDEVVAFDAGRDGDGPARVLAAAAILLDCARHVVAILDGSAHEPTT